MTVIVDKSGRVRLPKAMRDQFHLLPGTRLDVRAESDGLHLKIADPEGALLEKDGFLIHSGGERSDLDIADFINQVRENQSAYNIPIDEDLL